MLLRPQVERHRGDLVNEGLGEAVLAEVDGLGVGVAGVAALDPNVRELGRSIDGKLGVVFLVAAGADNTAELPLAQAKTAEQTAAGAVALLAEHSQPGRATAEWTQRVGVAFELERNPGANEFGVGLKKSKGEEFLGVGGRLGGGPAVVEQVRPMAGG